MFSTPGRLADAGLRTLTTLVDLVLPTDCAGCGASGPGTVCPACQRVLTTPPQVARPTPAPAGLPMCMAAGEYDGELRELILAYKERGRRGLAAPLGDALAATVLAATVLAGAVLAGAGGLAGGEGGQPQPQPQPHPLALVPVPSAPAAARARHGDHMLRLGRRAASRLRRLGWPVRVATPLRALPKQDSAQLDRQARARVAWSSFTVRRRSVQLLAAFADVGSIVVVDDVLTTGSTVAAVARRLFDAGAPVAFAATLAATRLRYPSASNASVEIAVPDLGMTGDVVAWTS